MNPPTYFPNPELLRKLADAFSNPAVLRRMADLAELEIVAGRLNTEITLDLLRWAEIIEQQYQSLVVVYAPTDSDKWQLDKEDGKLATFPDLQTALDRVAYIKSKGGKAVLTGILVQ